MKEQRERSMHKVPSSHHGHTAVCHKEQEAGLLVLEGLMQYTCSIHVTQHPEFRQLATTTKL